MPCSERRKEIKRRRHRQKKLAQLAKRLEKANVSERAAIADKLRSLTPGSTVLLANWGLDERD
jgi:transcription elongation GreA/GreB family factor